MKSLIFQKVIDLGVKQNIKVILRDGSSFFGKIKEIGFKYRNFVIQDSDINTLIISNSVACISYAESEK